MRFVLVVALLGCSSTRNPQKCLEGLCPDPALPFCDVDGSLNGEPNTCIAVSCTPNAFEECRGDRALTCNATGDNYELVQCEFGCGPDGCIACDSPECEKRIFPNYVSMQCANLADEESLVVDVDTGFDTGQGDCDATVSQPTGPAICVIHRRRIEIEANKTLKVRGTHALALIADYAFDLNGTLDVSADGTTNGPGVSDAIQSGSTATTTGAAGGAGYRTAGGAGGSDTATGGAANGGPAGLNPKLINELLGGRQTQQAANTQPPGGAGGAVTIISCRGKVTMAGIVDAGGGGGVRSHIELTTPQGATGGGTGGTVVIQGKQVAITGQLFANGGGGGAGGFACSLGGGCPKSGRDGERSSSAALGGTPPAGDTSFGGNGGTAQPPTSGGAGGGAGGASAGYILVYTPEGVLPELSPTAVSPGIEEPGVVATN